MGVCSYQQKHMLPSDIDRRSPFRALEFHYSVPAEDLTTRSARGRGSCS